MAQADWTELTGSLAVGTVDRGVTAGITPPNGGGSFIYGFNSLAVTAGAVGFFTNQANFVPMAKGGRITGCVKRGTSGGVTNFSPFLYIGIGGTATTDNCYMLGLMDTDPYHIALRKGQFSGGIPESTVGSLGILKRSTATYSPDTWHHLRLDMVVNVSGDVYLKCFANDLTTNAVTSPVWAAIAGMDDFIDDALGVNSGSAPYTSGRAGYGFVTSDISRRGYFDHIAIARQL
jgi:hypothetical protein